MTFEGDGTNESLHGGGHIPPKRKIPHYHGDEVRILFFVSALILIIAQSTNADLPFSTFGSIVAAVLLVVAAGITNPGQYWIHWIDGLLALIGTFIFGVTAIDHYRNAMSISDFSFVYIEALALLSLVSLYFTTRTIRGLLQKATLV